MVRRIALFICIFVLAFGVLSSIALSKAKVEITVAGPEDTKENQTAIELLRDKIARFEKQYPDIKVKLMHYAYNPQTFAIKQAGRTGPDVFGTWATEGRVLAEKGWIAPLDEYIKTWPKADMVNPAAYLPFTVDGKIYGIPDGGYVKHIMYNKKMFKERGLQLPKMNWTWEEFIEAAKKLTDQAKGIAGFAPMTRGTEGGWQLTDFIYQAGGECEERVGGKWKAVWDSEEAIKALQFVKDMKWKYDILPQNWSLAYMDVYNLFATGKAAMVPHGDWTVEWVINNFKWDPADIGLVPMPKGPGPKGRQAGVQGGNFTVINGLTSKEKRDAAFKWINFERWDKGEIEAYKKQIEDYRSKGIKLAVFTYPVLKPDSPIQRERDRIALANPDVAVVWPAEFRMYLLKTGHVEPPIECQKMYGEAMAPAIQAVLADKNADPERIMKESAKKFQKEVLDPFNAQNQ
ncbi:MAG TPA: sugar ABC transporter substrate-binding protein [Firmicutes bacterium]|nr:sugar ABC transporter substrate-binding protein [Bacillota bacterium]